MTAEQQRALEELGTYTDIATGAARRVDDIAKGELHNRLDPELRGHISIALQHLQAAQGMLANMEQAKGATNG